MKRSRTIFIGGLSEEITTKDVDIYFRQFGKIKNIVFKKSQNLFEKNAFAYLVFQDIQTIEIVMGIERHIIKGKRIDCQQAHGGKEKFKDVEIMKETKIHIKGQHADVTGSGLSNYFSQFGEVRQAYVVQDTENKKNKRNFGFIQFYDPKISQEVVEKTHIFNGRKAKLEKFQPKYKKVNTKKGLNTNINKKTREDITEIQNEQKKVNIENEQQQQPLDLYIDYNNNYNYNQFQQNLQVVNIEQTISKLMINHPNCEFQNSDEFCFDIQRDSQQLNIDEFATFSQEMQKNKLFATGNNSNIYTYNNFDKTYKQISKNKIDEPPKLENSENKRARCTSSEFIDQIMNTIQENDITTDNETGDSSSMHVFVQSNNKKYPQNLLQNQLIDAHSNELDNLQMNKDNLSSFYQKNASSLTDFNLGKVGQADPSDKKQEELKHKNCTCELCSPDNLTEIFPNDEIFSNAEFKRKANENSFKKSQCEDIHVEYPVSYIEQVNLNYIENVNSNYIQQVNPNYIEQVNPNYIEQVNPNYIEQVIPNSNLYPPNYKSIFYFSKIKDVYYVYPQNFNQSYIVPIDAPQNYVHPYVIQNSIPNNSVNNGYQYLSSEMIQRNVSSPCEFNIYPNCRNQE